MACPPKEMVLKEDVFYYPGRIQNIFVTNILGYISVYNYDTNMKRKYRRHGFWNSSSNNIDGMIISKYLLTWVLTLVVRRRMNNNFNELHTLSYTDFRHLMISSNVIINVDSVNK